MAPAAAAAANGSPQGYTLAIIGCGTMGVAVLSGVLDSKRIIEARQAASRALSQSQKRQTSPDGADASGGGTPQMDDLSASVASLLEINDDGESHGPAPAPAEGSSLSSAAAAASAAQASMQLPAKFLACVARTESAKRLRKTFEEHADVVQVYAADNLRAAKEADVILLACKPQMVGDVLAEDGMREALRGKLVCSICAGLTIKSICESLERETTVVRAMPNTPSKIREGMTILTPLPSTDHAATQSRSRLVAIFSAVGKCRILDEKHFDVATALAGSGPAFACMFLESMVDGAVMMGMPRKEALELAAQTMQGAARMVIQSGMHPAAIKDSVTTPGGCTIAGLLTLEDGGLRSTVARTIQAATEHAAGLGKPKK